jgi:hypothetical protein
MRKLVPPGMEQVILLMGNLNTVISENGSPTRTAKESGHVRNSREISTSNTCTSYKDLQA